MSRLAFELDFEAGFGPGLGKHGKCFRAYKDGKIEYTQDGGLKTPIMAEDGGIYNEEPEKEVEFNISR